MATVSVVPARLFNYSANTPINDSHMSVTGPVKLDLEKQAADQTFLWVVGLVWWVRIEFTKL